MGGGDRQQAVHGVFWLALERMIGFSVSFGGGIVLARILSPTDFGLVALASSFFLIAGRLSGIGINFEIVRADKTRPNFAQTLHTWFWLNAFLTIIVCVAVCLFSLFSNFFSSEGGLVACAVAGGWTINNLFDPCRRLLQRDLRFRALSFLQWVPGALGMLGGVIMAISGYGVWALVLPQMVCLALAGVWAFTISGYRPALVFHWPDAVSVLRKAPYYVGGSLCEGAYQKADTLAVGKYFGEGMLGFYDRAYVIGSLFYQNIGTILTRIALPLFARRADDPAEVARLYSVVVRAILYLSFFAICFFCLYAPQIITGLWGDKWLTSAQIFRVMAPYSILLPAFHITKEVLFALGEVKHATKAYFWVLLTVCVAVYPGMRVGEYAGSQLGTDMGGLYGAACAVDIALVVGLWQMIVRLIIRAQAVRILSCIIRPLVISLLALAVLVGSYLVFMPFTDANSLWQQLLLGIMLGGLWCALFLLIMLFLERDVLAFALRAGSDLPVITKYCRWLHHRLGLLSVVTKSSGK